MAMKKIKCKLILLVAQEMKLYKSLHECNLKICVTCMKGNELLLEYVYILARIKLSKMKIYVVKFKTNKNYKPFTKNK